MSTSSAPMDASSSLYSDSTIPLVMGTTTSLLILALITFALRIYSRVYPYRTLGVDDYAMTLAMALSLIDWGLTLATNILTKGKRMFFIDPETMMMAIKYSFISMPIWVWAMAFIKTSVCLMLLRIKTTMPWRVGIGFLIFTNLAAATAATIAQLLQCTPIATNWNPTLGKCWEPQKIQTSIYSCTSIFIVTDFACALLPLAFIAKVNRPMRERVALAVTMGLGCIAGACGIAKLVLVSRITASSDPIWQNANLAIYAYAEQYIGIVAACIPCLKALLEKAFRKVGGHISSFNNTKKQTGVNSTNKPTSVQLDTVGAKRSVYATKQGTFIESETASSKSDEVRLCNDISGQSAPKDVEKRGSPYIVKETAVEWKSNGRNQS